MHACDVLGGVAATGQGRAVGSWARCGCRPACGRPRARVGGPSGLGQCARGVTSGLATPRVGQHAQKGHHSCGPQHSDGRWRAAGGQPAPNAHVRGMACAAWRHGAFMAWRPAHGSMWQGGPHAPSPRLHTCPPQTRPAHAPAWTGAAQAARPACRPWPSSCCPPAPPPALSALGGRPFPGRAQRRPCASGAGWWAPTLAAQFPTDSTWTARRPLRRPRAASSCAAACCRRESARRGKSVVLDRIYNARSLCATPSSPLSPARTPSRRPAPTNRHGRSSTRPGDRAASRPRGPGPPPLSHGGAGGAGGGAGGADRADGQGHCALI